LDDVISEITAEKSRWIDEASYEYNKQLGATKRSIRPVLKVRKVVDENPDFEKLALEILRKNKVKIIDPSNTEKIIISRGK
jgi:hypothetical protein